ncbi:MAG TPA: error-prone DNA polymerase [Opitutaceae bacterium]|nr:error-prone DNA polymerase [Opitutaceae bacterium]
MSYVELHARSAFSWLRGGSAPEAIAREAARLQLPAVALCDRGGVYGAVRLHQTAKEAGVRALVGTELPMEDGSVVPVLAATREGYRAFCRLLTAANLRAEKGEGRVAWSELAADNTGLIALTGDEDGPLRRAWRTAGDGALAEAGARLEAVFGRERLYVELQRQLVPDEEVEDKTLVAWARARGLPLLATGGVLHATAADRHVSDVFTCLREHTPLDRAGRLLARNDERCLKPAAAMTRLFADLPEAVANTVRLADRLEYTLADLGYRFPDFPVPPGETQENFLRAKTYEGARDRYGELKGEVRRQLDHELALITRLGFCGYFLIVWDLCRTARERGTLVQGRGSAANSAVCYSLGITAVDPIGGKLLFERFLSEGRTDWPDIDLDLPSRERREEMIQLLYQRYGRRGAAMTANVITFRGRSAMREVGKVLGLPDDVLDRFSSLFHSGDFPETLQLEEQLATAGVSRDHPRFRVLVETCRRVHGLPRHLGQHSGGMVLCAGSLDDYVPLENARMPGRSVLQWDKSDCEDMGLVKIDLLGLGMMAVLQDSLELCRSQGEPVDLAKIPKDDPATFKLMQEADTIGVFQIESRAQMATLPRMKPENFYDLAIEVAIIRPGPIHGDAVNPYLERRAGRQPVLYPDGRVRPILERTLGVILFQEQILRIAMELGGFTAAEADELRRAIGFTRSTERLERMAKKLREALRRNAVTAEAADYIMRSLASFALYGFPESHALSFALIAYASAWLKVHRPAEFFAALLNNQPMGFYSPASLVQDARRHGVKTLPVCVAESAARCQVADAQTIRLGLLSVHGVREEAVAALVAERARRAFSSLADFLRRTGFTAAERRQLAGAGALNALAGHRRAALWRVEEVDGDDELFRYAALQDDDGAAPLEPMTPLERVQADYAHLSLTTGAHPMAQVRARFPDLWPAARLAEAANGTRVKIGGLVITRQRPGTAKGVCFITLEDETGLANAIVRPRLFEECRLTINLEPALVIAGRVQNEQGVIHVLAEHISALPSPDLPAQASHDYH